jgi:acyl-CoA thioester hydrolase
MTPLAAPSAAAAARYRHRVRVYWEDTDAGGVVFYANYLKFFERARTEWLRSLGIGQQALRERTGAIFIVVEAALRFVQPARLDDWLDVTVDVGEKRPATLLLEQQALRDGELLCSARVRIGCVDHGTFRPRRIPSEITSRL